LDLMSPAAGSGRRRVVVVAVHPLLGDRGEESSRIHAPAQKGISREAAKKDSQTGRELGQRGGAR